MSELRQRKSKTEPEKNNHSEKTEKSDPISPEAQVQQVRQYTGKYSKYWHGYTIYHFLFIFCMVFGMKLSNWMYKNGIPSGWDLIEMDFWRQVLTPRKN